ncbi:MAG TPA: hypothetical protein VMN03_06435 [Burkholderiales bacterium]|nr:hypothetical protein [Burkholderiales bacterium]
MHEFNLRMRAGGSPWGFFVEPEPQWIPKRPGQKVWREYYVAVDEAQQVRGGFALKPQEWWVRGEPHVVTDGQGPFSEGSVDPRFATLALRMVREMLSQRPILYSWGHGGNEQPLVQMLQRMGWLLHGTPFCLRILRPTRFLRLNAYLRTTPPRRLALDLIAGSGAGALGIAALHALLRLRMPRRFRARAVEVAEFGPWADEVWERCRRSYAAIAARDAASMNVLAPAAGWPRVTRLKIEIAGRVAGWALVMDTRLQDDARFGDLYVGSIVDCLAEPADAGEVVACATGFLRRRGVDLIASNQSHPGWIRGFANNGYLVLPGRRLFAASPALQQLLEPFELTAQGLHLTNMDGHGPAGL